MAETRLYDLVMSDNSIVKVSMAGVGQQGDLWVHVHNLSMIECATIFTDPQKTSLMLIAYDENISDRFDNYTNLFSLSVCDDFIKVGIARGETNA